MKSHTMVQTGALPHSNRLEGGDLLQQAEALRNALPLEDLYEAVTDLILILNLHRQIVFANRNCLRMLDLETADEVLGKRPGELFGCIRSTLAEGGCGSSDFCKECGALHAICNGLSGQPDARECRILLDEMEGALDLWVRTTPLEIEAGSFLVVALNDISNEKRRKVLERIFFHDLINTAGGIRGLVEVLKDADPLEQGDYLRMLGDSSEQLLDEIRSQRLLLRAENGELAVCPEEVFVAPMIDSLRECYMRHEAGMGKRIHRHVDQLAAVKTDRALLYRVLSNMLKNALEASTMREPVTVTVAVENERAVFKVHNQAVMPENVRRQVFQRSFSTKGAGRGIGTYSMRLLAGRYLKGEVRFHSLEGEGTTFVLDIPRILAVPDLPA